MDWPIIELLIIEIDPEVRAAFAEELGAGGMKRGNLTIGGMINPPDMAYLLWQNLGEMPVADMIPHDAFLTEEAARSAARDFIGKWNQLRE